VHPSARVAFDRVVEIRKAQRISVEEDRRIVDSAAMRSKARGLKWLTSPANSTSAGLSRVKGVEDERAEPASRTLKSLLAGKIQGILSISPVGSSQMAQNIVRITIPYEKIPGALEQGNFGSHQGIELGNQLLSGKELSLASVGICAK
jgi:hypothetical protein